MFCLKNQFIFLSSCMIEKILLCSFIICMIQYYLYSTNVAWEYLNIFTKIFKSSRANIFFHGVLMIGPAKNQPHYIAYLNSTYNNFFTKLISCPICTGFWMSVIASIIIGNLLYFALIGYISLCLYYFIKILTNKAGSL